jgi:urea ABC transporter permease protein UrtB
MDDVVNQGLSILNSVSTLVIISLGLAVIYGMMRVINLAHGEFLMLGAFAVVSGRRAGLPLWVAMVLAPLVVGAIGLVVERLIIRFLYGRLVETMLATWGLSLAIVQIVVIIYGPSTRGIETPLASFTIGFYSFSEYSLVMIVVAALLLAAVFLVFTRTTYGVRARAATQLPEMAQALGVNTSRANMLTFAFGSALAGAAGALLAPLTGVVPSMGQAFIARAFMTVIVGGQGVLTGTSAASGLLGTTEYVVSDFSTQFFGQAALLVAAIILVRLRPHGLSASWRRQL